MARMTQGDIVRFVPHLTAQRAARMTQPMSGAEADDLHGALLFADISGFSRMTEALASRSDGAEQIGHHLNQYLGRLVDLIEAHGGDVLKFAGDAVIAFWPGTPQDAGVARAAAACALRAQRDLAGFRAGDVTLSMRICISSGAVRLLHVGGVLNRWETVPSGTPVTDLAALKPLTPIGAVVVSAETWVLLGDGFAGAPAQHDANAASSGILSSVPDPSPNVAPVAAGPAPMQLRWSEALPAGVPLHREPGTSEAEERFRAWVPGVLLSIAANGVSEWLSELRRVSVVFVQLPLVTAEGVDLARLHGLVAALQRSVYRYDGGIDKISVDEKGAVLIAAFGLPPLSHEDDPARSLHAAMAMRKVIADHGVPANIGVATGQVFCGTVGTTSRCEYTVIGHTVNLAARLMEASHGRLLCDEATQRLATSQLEVLPVETMAVRGRQEPVRVFSPSGLVRAAVRAKHALVGRATERDALSRAMQSVLRAHQSADVVVEGEAGIGKSRLLNELEQQAVAFGMRVLRGAGDAVDRNVPYLPWRTVFAELFGIGPADSAHDRSAKVDAAVALLPADLRALSPLVESVIALEHGHDDAVDAFSGAARQAQTHRVLIGLLEQAVQSGQLCIILEDCHWMDSASWALLRELRVTVKPLLIVLATRPLEQPIPEYDAHLADASVQRLRLVPLGSDDCGALAAQRLGVRTVPPEVIDFIAQRAGGNALYVEELAAVLHEKGSLIVNGDQAQLAVTVQELSRTPLPATVEGLIVSRLDALEAGQQLALKVASVVGRQFPVDVVRDVYPLPERQPEVIAMLPMLVDQDLLRFAELPAHFLFKHVLTQEAVYGLMLFGQRRGLHRAVAEWYEKATAEDPLHVLPVLAHHWHSAEEWARAVTCLERSAEQNLERFANREAVELLNQAMALDRDHPGLSTPARQATWQRQLAEA